MNLIDHMGNLGLKMGRTCYKKMGAFTICILLTFILGGMTPEPTGKHFSLVAFSNAWIDDIVVDPQKPSTIYVLSNGLYKSTDSGAMWSSLLDNDTTANIYPDWILMNPQNSANLYIGCGGPYPNTGGLYRSQDGGKTWQKVSEMKFFRCVIDPRTPNVLLGATYYEGIYRSLDSGATWSLVYAYPPPKSIGLVHCTALKIHPSNANVIFASIAEETDAHEPKAVYTVWTDDRGDLWQTRDYSFREIYCYQILCIDSFPDLVLGRHRSHNYGGLIKSFDMGGSWEPDCTGFDQDSPYAVYSDPMLHGAMFVCSCGGLFWREGPSSRWQLVDMEDKHITCMAFDTKSNIVYVGTENGLYSNSPWNGEFLRPLIQFP